MHFLLRLPYAAFGAAARLAARLAPPGGGKIRSSLRARRGILARYADWGARARDTRRPLVWLHAPSVGEGLQARPVIARLRASAGPTCRSPTRSSRPARNGSPGASAPTSATISRSTPRADADAALDALRPDALCVQQARRVAGARRARRRARRAARPRCPRTLAETPSRRSGIGALRAARCLPRARRGRRDFATTMPRGSSSSACARIASPSPATRDTTRRGRARNRRAGQRALLDPLRSRPADARRGLDVARGRGAAARRVARRARAFAVERDW